LIRIVAPTWHSLS